MDHSQYSVQSSGNERRRMLVTRNSLNCVSERYFGILARDRRRETTMKKGLPLASWNHRLAFWAGSGAVAAGVALHVPMFLMGRKTGYRLVGMPMG